MVIIDVSGQPVGPIFRGFLDSNMGPIECPEIIINYHYSLRDKPDGRNSHLLSGGSLVPCLMAVIRIVNMDHRSVYMDYVRRKSNQRNRYCN